MSDLLIEACKNNDAKAQMQLYDVYVEAMFTVAMHYVRQTDIAEDVVQEAFIKAFKKIGMFNGKVTFGAWLKRIVINQALDYLKKRKIELVDIDDVNISLVVEDENWDFALHLKVTKIKDGILKLKYKYSTVLKLYLLEGYDHQEIAQILNISEVVSRTQLKRGKDQLRILLNKDNYGK